MNEDPPFTVSRIEGKERKHKCEGDVKSPTPRKKNFYFSNFLFLKFFSLSPLSFPDEPHPGAPSNVAPFLFLDGFNFGLNRIIVNYEVIFIARRILYGPLFGPC